MCEMARKLLAEKLVDDFYKDDRWEQEPVSQTDLTEQLKAILPVDQYELLFRWKAECAENCGQELRQFADFVARMLMECKPDGEADGELIPLLPIQD